MLQPALDASSIHFVFLSLVPCIEMLDRSSFSLICTRSTPHRCAHLSADVTAAAPEVKLEKMLGFGDARLNTYTRVAITLMNRNNLGCATQPHHHQVNVQVLHVCVDEALPVRERL